MEEIKPEYNIRVANRTTDLWFLPESTLRSLCRLARTLPVKRKKRIIKKKTTKVKKGKKKK